MLFCASGLRASLERLQLEYVDVVFANRPDPNTPMEGRCSCFNLCILPAYVCCLPRPSGTHCAVLVATAKQHGLAVGLRPLLIRLLTLGCASQTHGRVAVVVVVIVMLIGRVCCILGVPSLHLWLPGESGIQGTG